MLKRIRAAWLRDAESPVDVRHVDVLDGVRAIAIFIVAWFHIWQQSWMWPVLEIGSYSLNLDSLVRSGYMFVDVMLLISGFLLFLPYARQRALGEKPPSIPTFYARRAARILPSYWLVLLLVFVISAMVTQLGYSLPQGWFSQGGSFEWAAFWKDLLSHLTFTQVFSYDTYVATRFDVVLWTLAVEVQFYLIFPFLAKLFVRWPVWTWLGMAAAGLAFRYGVVLPAEDTTLLVNQLPAFLDVYANGMLFAIIYVRLAKQLKHTSATRILFTILSILLLFPLWQLVRNQAASPGHAAIRVAQAQNRFYLSVLCVCFIVAAANAGKGLRFLLSNRFMRLCSAISFQFYIYHQFLAVILRTIGFPPSAWPSPNEAGDLAWQWQFTLLAFGLPFALSVLLTYCFERPMAKWLLSRWDNVRAMKKQRLPLEE